MRSDNLTFSAKNLSRVKHPRYAIRINFDPSNPNSGINKWIGSHEDTQFPENVVAPGDSYTYAQLQELFAETPENWDYHGGSCDFSDDGTVLITAAAAFDGGSDYRTGKLMIWDRNSDDSFTINTTFQPSDGTADDHFPLLAYISGDGTTILVGSPREATSAADAGAFYILRKVAGTWTEIDRIEMTTPVANAQFAWKGSISYDGNRVLVSAPFDPNGGTNRGTVWVIETDDDWSTHTLTEIARPTLADSVYFGYCCAMSDNGLVALVGEYYNSQQGRVRVYKRPDYNSPWEHIQVLTAFDGDTGDNFGIGVSGYPTLFAGTPMIISDDGEHVAIGAHRWDDDVLGIQTGCAYYFHFENNQFVLKQQIIPSQLVDMSSSPFAWFSYKMAFSSRGRRLLIGCQSYHNGTDDTGTAFLFDLSGQSYKFLTLINPDTPQQWEYGGFSCALDGSGRLAATGATDFDTTSPSVSGAGRVVVFDVSAEVAYTGLIKRISGTTQYVNPIKMMSSVGNMSFDILDENEDINTMLNDLLTRGYGTRHATVDFYMGYKGLPWDNYIKFQSQIISDDSEHDGLWKVRCEDIQRQMREKIFQLEETNITQTIEIDDTTVYVRSTQGFQMVEHKSSYADAPNQIVGYFKVEDEIFSYTGMTDDSFTGVVGGRFGTAKKRHEFDDGSSTEPDRQLEVTEFVYLEMPIMKLMYAILTGDLLNQPGKKLPEKWHLGISPIHVATTFFQYIGNDLWDPTDTTDAAGFSPRFTGEEEQDGFKFIAEQLLPLAGCYLRVLHDGQLAPKRMVSVLPNSAYDFIIDKNNVISYGPLNHKQSKIHNRFTIHWNKNEFRNKLTRADVFDDYFSQVVNNGIANPLEFEMRGLHGSRHAKSTIGNRFTVLQDRYSGAPDQISVTLKHSMNTIEVGDIAFVNLENVRDYTGAMRKLQRAMEVQNVSIDWVNGGVRVDLFGSTQKAYRQSYTTYPGGGTTGLNSTFYTTGRALTSELTTSLIGDVLHITTSGTLTGADSLLDTSGTGSNFYYNGNVEIDEGVVVTIEGNVHLRIGGFFQNNGKIDGRANGIAGGTAFSYGSDGAIGTTHSMGGLELNYSYQPSGWCGNFGPTTVVSTPGLTHQGNLAPTGSLPPLALENNDGDLVFNITDLRGVPGPGGAPVNIDPADWRWEENGYHTTFDGGTGGNSGAGLMITCQGMAFGLLNQSVEGDGTIDLSGGPGQLGTCTDSGLDGGSFCWTQLVGLAGSGGSGHPGGLYINLDGSDSLAPELSNRVIAEIPHIYCVGYRHQGEANLTAIRQSTQHVRDQILNLDVTDPDANYEGLTFNDILSFHVRSNYVGAHYDASQLNDWEWIGIPDGKTLITSPDVYRYDDPIDFVSLDVGDSVAIFQFVPENDTPQEDVSEVTSAPTLATPVEYQNTPETAGQNLATIEVAITPPSDGNYSYSNVYYKTSTQSIEDYLFIGSYTSEFTVQAPMDGTTYNFLVKPVSILNVESDDGVTANHTVSNTTGGLESGLVGGWSISSTQLYNGTDIVLDSSNKQISINSSTFQNAGVQMGYYSGNYKFHVGNGVDQGLVYDPTATLPFRLLEGTAIIGAPTYNRNDSMVIPIPVWFSRDGVNYSETGSGTVTVQTSRIRCNVTAADGDKADIQIYLSATLNDIGWDKSRGFQTIIVPSTDANNEIYVITGFTTVGCGFRWNGTTWQCWSYDGTTEETTNISLSANDIEVQYDAYSSPREVRFYVGGSLVATHQTNIPPTTTSEQAVFYVSNERTAAGAVSRTVQIGDTKIIAGF